ncbi:histone-fold-containing protein [Sporodiniella umbellata]|nr:histone-fold-containing protein [Sporodiniella umbellata]
MSESVSIEEFELPKTVVARVLKSFLPEGTNLSKEARVAANKAATVFVSYLASVSNDVAKSANHKTVAASDVLKALEIVELDNLIDPLKEHLEGYQQHLADRKSKKKDGDESKSKPEEEDEEMEETLTLKTLEDEEEDEDEDMETLQQNQASLE